MRSITCNCYGHNNLCSEFIGLRTFPLNSLPWIWHRHLQRVNQMNLENYFTLLMGTTRWMLLCRIIRGRNPFAQVLKSISPNYIMQLNLIARDRNGNPEGQITSHMFKGCVHFIRLKGISAHGSLETARYSHIGKCSTIQHVYLVL